MGRRIDHSPLPHIASRQRYQNDRSGPDRSKVSWQLIFCGGFANWDPVKGWRQLFQAATGFAQNLPQLTISHTIAYGLPYRSGSQFLITLGRDEMATAVTPATESMEDVSAGLNRDWKRLSRFRRGHVCESVSPWLELTGTRNL